MAENIFAMVPVEVLADKRLTLEQMRVLIALLSFRSRNTDLVWPARDALAERAGGMHPANISKATSALVKLGWLEKDGNGGRSQSCCYRIIVPDLEKLSTTVAESATPPLETLADSATVKESETVADSATHPPETLAHSATKTVADSARGKEETIEQTIKSNRQGACAREAADERPPGKAKSENLNARGLLTSFDVPPDLADSFIRVRNKKQLAITAQALMAIQREGEALGLTLVETITVCCENGWGGFKSKWGEAQEAAADFRRRKNPDEIHDGKAQGPPKTQSTGRDWRKSADGVLNRARELNIEPKAGESGEDFRRRVEKVDWEHRQARLRQLNGYRQAAA